eukprot:CAMPEP_0181317994 /NCGR_PEP_ID=MMETSP1101-20121128/16768_1 /TAXON_ID=46948 /ORGANISM="Rhodomonas abbreviata, Strain Caron Lab Isolate" /LENGTH=339 /DNA_ID=CAMNT_0023425431 /DNA_START=24 /DNA_END=1043 /DNA_ORIENTATION=+
MADPNGKEAGIAFLAENKNKDGVITLPSGLQYKVLEEGGGLEHPKVDTPCECHYAGRLLDGTQFDSSYDRGEPTTFAPNQVIKGWTEAMQLMAQGDKWELYIPMEMAYGPSGRPPKIPAAATLIFIMEIVKIKGATVPKTVTFPEWTPEQLALWLEKDEAACQKWRDAKASQWEGGDAKLKESYPTRAALDEWLDATCLNSKNKSLWKRTHAKKPAAASGAAAGAGAGRPALTKESARALLTKVLDKVKEPANKEKLEGVVKECEGADPANAGMMKMMKLLPAVEGILGPVLLEAGFKQGELTTAAMEIQAFSAADPSIAADTAALMAAVQGDLTALLK